MSTQGNDRYTALVSFLDRFTLDGGIDLALAKTTSLRDDQADINYVFNMQSGCQFRAAIYHFAENDVSHPFFALCIQMCPLNSISNQHVILNNMLVDSCDLPSPQKFALAGGNIAICVRVKVSAVESDYLERLILDAMDIANQVVGILVEKHGATAVANIPAQNRMVQ
ncbi:MAG: hypothetical protein IPK68_04100 [Bdellovibrionales bacterium]|nr:hypothetical protein [Bdellovibrionales bacterium]